MKDEFFQSLIDALQAENRKRHTADVPGEILEAFFGNVPKAAAAPQKMPQNTPAPRPAEPGAPAGSLAEIAAAISGCSRCRLCEKRTNPVPGEGHPDADLMFIGEGPGADEDLQGLAFVGKAGQLLTKMIALLRV